MNDDVAGRGVAFEALARMLGAPLFHGGQRVRNVLFGS
jgi:hypothetical protein